MNKKVEDLKSGDRVDLTTCPYCKDYPSSEYEWAIVDGIVKETDNCIRVMYEDFDWIGYPVGTVLMVRDKHEDP